jgi:hypothetical protein
VSGRTPPTAAREGFDDEEDGGSTLSRRCCRSLGSGVPVFRAGITEVRALRLAAGRRDFFRQADDQLDQAACRLDDSEIALARVTLASATPRGIAWPPMGLIGQALLA